MGLDIQLIGTQIYNGPSRASTLNNFCNRNTNGMKLYGKYRFLNCETILQANSNCKQTRQWFKFMHNLQPLGTRKQQTGNHLAQSAMLTTCPCCNPSAKDQRHLIVCAKNPNFNQAHISLTTYGSKCREHHQFVDIMTDCIEQWLMDPNKYPGIDTPTNPNLEPYTNHLKTRMMTILQEALAEQHSIGWLNAIWGFLSKKWQLLASTRMKNLNALVNTQDGS
jgi:hypothetical protein